MQIREFARFAQNYAVRLSEFVRKKNSFPRHRFERPPNPARTVTVYDHILVRNAKPVYALVRHFGAEKITDDDQRAEAFMRAAGSDHYPLEAIIQID
jgi:hypothetical protein